MVIVLDDGTRANQSGSKSFYLERLDLEISTRLPLDADASSIHHEATMAARYLDYYTSVADRMLPFLQGRQVAIEQRFPRSKGTVYRRHTGGTRR